MVTTAAFFSTCTTNSFSEQYMSVYTVDDRVDAAGVWNWQVFLMKLEIPCLLANSNGTTSQKKLVIPYLC